jgi:hypothetical protein
VWSDYGVNDCPAGSYRIGGESLCRDAAATAGRTFVASSPSSQLPSGCYMNQNKSENEIYFNGNGDEFLSFRNCRLLCTTGKGMCTRTYNTHTHTRARAHAPTHSQGRERRMRTATGYAWSLMVPSAMPLRARG